MRRLAFIVALLALLAFAGVAQAASPEDTVAGTGRTWFTGTTLTQWGTNCQILGVTRPEAMVQSTATYGGATGIPAVGERYWMSILVGVTGMPCGQGIALVSTDAQLPTGVQIDTSRRIRCFVTKSYSSTFDDVTGQSFDWDGMHYEFCPASAGLSRFQGALSFGYRLLASGQMFQLLVPVTSTQPLGGARTRWLIDGSGVYSDEQPGTADVATTVLQTSLGGTPSMFFTQPAATPFWNASAPAGQENQVEYFLNLYTAGKAGQLTFDLLDATGAVDSRSSDLGGLWDPNVPAGSLNVLQLRPGTGPNKGYVPWAYPPGLYGGRTYRLRWTFTTATGTYTKLTPPFRILPGPDADGDGVADAEDRCPAVKGSGADGCPPAVQPDTDKDGVAGAADRCPTVSGLGDPSGCPAPKGTLRAPHRLRRRIALQGAKVRFTCTAASTATVRLLVPKAQQRALGLTTRELPIALAAKAAACRPGTTGAVTVKVARAYAARLRRSHGTARATFELRLVGKGGATRVVKAPVVIS